MTRLVLSFIEIKRIKKRFSVWYLQHWFRRIWQAILCVVDIKKLQKFWNGNENSQGMEVTLEMSMISMKYPNTSIWWLPAKLYAQRPLGLSFGDFRMVRPARYQWDHHHNFDADCSAYQHDNRIIDFDTWREQNVVEHWKHWAWTIGISGRSSYTMLFISSLWVLVFGKYNWLGVALLQKFHFITLDEASYYLSVAPNKIDWSSMLLLNIGTTVVFWFFLILPTT